jgi:hypothetical protein
VGEFGAETGQPDEIGPRLEVAGVLDEHEHQPGQDGGQAARHANAQQRADGPFQWWSGAG